ncbi:MAG: 4-hydroxy-3-methylbut-2-enyl diphosphate reductase [Acidimicrobiaceae bacterium]|nr:4-hydroxy-3-methylbut-2-enyl diphosphate reductase [Acidimicrobiaceae bacterium]|tara:strand:+ start:1367 stop:2395 length:1029 start_codon:yes stop_codon:yes gene_type:complete
MAVNKVLLASPRGFCAGVEMAIKALTWMVRAFPSPVYCYHEIVHNKVVVERFEALGVIFVDDIDEVPSGYPVMLSAHGSAPEVVASAREQSNYVVDAVCPLVTKVHHEVKVRVKKGHNIIYIGHQGHEEAVGTVAVAPEATHIVESTDAIENLPEFAGDVSLLAQTTLSHRDWESILEAAKERFPSLEIPGKSDLCFATTNRQGALMSIAEQCDSVIVIGSENSSNTRALERLATEVGCKEVHRINHASEVPRELSGIVGVTAGASAPEELVNAVLEKLAPVLGVEELSFVLEEEYFPPPRELRTLIQAIGFFSKLGLMSEGIQSSTDDRSIEASEVLTALK